MAGKSEQIIIESIVNIGNEMPFALVNPSGEVLWMCGPDESGNITSIFQNPKKKNERQVTYLKNKTEAQQYRATLLLEGWILATAPKVTVTTQK